MAGAVGFEPTDGGSKVRCLTAWLRPRAFQTLWKGPWCVNHIFLRSANSFAKGLQPTLILELIQNDLLDLETGLGVDRMTDIAELTRRKTP